MSKSKFVKGERVRVKAGDLKMTGYHCGVDPSMRNLVGKVLTITITDEEMGGTVLAVKASGYFWHPDDLEKLIFKPKPKGGSFKIENLVV